MTEGFDLQLVSRDPGVVQLILDGGWAESA
jgi:hypothetical protein